MVQMMLTRCDDEKEVQLFAGTGLVHGREVGNDFVDEGAVQ